MKPERVEMCGGQKLLVFQDSLLFVLESGVYQLAGSRHWPDKKEISQKGIGLNRRLYRKIMKSEKQFLVYNQRSNELYQLEDQDLVLKCMGQEEKAGRKICILPLEAFQSFPLPVRLMPEVRTDAGV